MNGKSNTSNSFTTSDLELESAESDTTNDKIFAFQPSDLLNKEKYEEYQKAIIKKLKRTKESYLKVAPHDRVNMASLCLTDTKLEEEEERLCVSPRKNKEIKSRLQSIRNKYAESLQLIEEMPVEFSQNFNGVIANIQKGDDGANKELRFCLNNSFCKTDFQKLKPQNLNKRKENVNLEERVVDKENMKTQNLDYTPIKEAPLSKENSKKKKIEMKFETEIKSIKKKKEEDEEVKKNNGNSITAVSNFRMKNDTPITQKNTSFKEDSGSKIIKQKFSLKNFKKNYFPSKITQKGSPKIKKKIDETAIHKRRTSYRKNETSFYSNSNTNKRSTSNEKFNSLKKNSTKKNNILFSKSNLNSPASKNMKILGNESKKNSSMKKKIKNRRISFNSNRNYNTNKIINLNIKKTPNYIKDLIQREKIKRGYNSNKNSSKKKKTSYRETQENTKKIRNMPFNSPKKNFGRNGEEKPRSQDLDEKSKTIMKKITTLRKKSLSRRKIKKNKSFVNFNSKSKRRRQSFKSDKKVNSLNISKIENQINLLSSSKKYTTKRARHHSYIEKQNIKKISEFDLGKTQQVVKKLQDDRKEQRIKLLEETIFQQNELIKRLLKYMKEDDQKRLKDQIKELKEQNRELKLKLMRVDAKEMDFKKLR